eukprot:2753315-Rhodomonas_salina.4
MLRVFRYPARGPDIQCQVERRTTDRDCISSRRSGFLRLRPHLRAPSPALQLTRAAGRGLQEADEGQGVHCDVQARARGLYHRDPPPRR